MKSKFEEVSSWGAKWVGTTTWQSPTVDEITAEKLVTGYSRFLDKIVGVSLMQLARLGTAIDIGCGAGHITQAFKRQGVPISGSEYDATAVAFARSMQPELELHESDLSSFLEPNRYALIFTRKVYLFTRVNDFDRQRQILSNLIASLCPGGILLLVASARSEPDCLDFSRAIEAFRKDCRIACVTETYLEPVLKHLGAFIFGHISYKCITLLLAPYIALQKLRRKWGPSLLVAFVKAK
jgi:SAM-dependent methyltransferase